jgi:hypothetical protein
MPPLAPACPNCGRPASNFQGVKDNPVGTILGCAGFLIILILSAVISSSFKRTDSAETKSSVRSTINISAERLYSEYKTNPDLAAIDYQGKKLRLTMRVRYINYSYLSTGCVFDTDITGHQLYATFSSGSGLADLRVGQTVSAVCTGGEYRFGNRVTLEDCSLSW